MPRLTRKADKISKLARQLTYHCDCRCPHWGHPSKQVQVRCDCGVTEWACVPCLTAGRITACLTCMRKETPPCAD